MTRLPLFEDGGSVESEVFQFLCPSLDARPMAPAIFTYREPRRRRTVLNSTSVRGNVKIRDDNNIVMRTENQCGNISRRTLPRDCECVTCTNQSVIELRMPTTDS